MRARLRPRLRPLPAALLLVLLAALASALAACGSTTKSGTGGGPQAKKQIVPGSGGREMSAADVGTVVSASRSLESACPSALVPGVRPDPAAAVQTLIGVARRVGSNAIVEYGSLPEAMPMGRYLAWEGRLVSACGLRAPAAALQRAARAA